MNLLLLKNGMPSDERCVVVIVVLMNRVSRRCSRK